MLFLWTIWKNMPMHAFRQECCATVTSCFLWTAHKVPYSKDNQDKARPDSRVTPRDFIFFLSSAFFFFMFLPYVYTCDDPGWEPPDEVPSRALSLHTRCWLSRSPIFPILLPVVLFTRRFILYGLCPFSREKRDHSHCALRIYTYRKYAINAWTKMASLLPVTLSLVVVIDHKNVSGVVQNSLISFYLSTQETRDLF